jgi:hypothetical protein
MPWYYKLDRLCLSATCNRNYTLLMMLLLLLLKMMLLLLVLLASGKGKFPLSLPCVLQGVFASKRFPCGVEGDRARQRKRRIVGGLGV